MSLETSRKNINDILELLNIGEWQIPQFQREFVWSPEQVKNLINSFIKSYPIGLITIWVQPQNKPHTPGEPLSLKEGSKYKKYEQDPALIKLVLDGKQRLTTLAMVFGGLHTKDDRYTYSGNWFVDLDAMIRKDESNFVKYKKQKEIFKENLTTLTVCVNKGLIPLKDFHKIGEYVGNINNPDIYPEGKFPDKEIRENRLKITNQLSQNYSRFQIPIAEIPSSVDLGAVCEIFDVLNTTGTNVSTFDLLHNLLFKYSSGEFQLRENFKVFSDLDYFGFLCDEKRQDFFVQIVTGCYLSEPDPFKTSNSNERITNIKGKDLIDTPLNFYQKIYKNSKKVDNYCEDLFKHVLNGTFRLGEIPYPVQIILYISLRWHLEINKNDDPETINELNKIFKAFFWRNTLASRYDQGFLAQFSRDLENLKAILLNNFVNRGKDWAEIVNKELDELFRSDNPTESKEKLLAIIQNDDIKGALNQGITILLNSKSTKDILTCEPLDRFTEQSRDKVQLHHIFPKQWCKDNLAMNPIIEELGVNHFSNLMPLSAASNNKWKTNAPSTAIKQLNLKFNLNANIFETVYISSNNFESLKKDDIVSFWKSRADDIADDLYKLQFVN